MSKEAINDVQKALNAIRSITAEENAETQMAVLALMLSTSESIVANTRKISSAKTQQKPRTHKRAQPKAPIAKQNPAPSNDRQDTDDTEQAREKRNTAAVKPQPPLTIQQQQQ